MKDEVSPTPQNKGTRMRSPAYPVFGLSEAIKKARSLWDAQRKNDGHLDSVIHAIGYGGRNGSSLRAVGALNHYGLIEESGAKDNRRIRLSEIAQDILHLREDDPRRADSLKTAALSPTIHAVLWERYQNQPPSDAALKSFLVREKDFGDEAAAEVIKNYRDSFELARLGILIDPPQEYPENSANDNLLNSSSPPNTVVLAAPTKFYGGGPAFPTGFVKTTQELPILVDHGQVARIPFPMSEDAFDLLIGTLNLWKKKLVPAPESTPVAIPVYTAFPIPLHARVKGRDGDSLATFVGILKAEGQEDRFVNADGNSAPASEVTFIQ